MARPGSLLPHARPLIVDKDGLICLGSGSLFLGLLAHLMGLWDDALRHLDEALAAHTRINSPPWIANTSWATAKVLLARNGPGDRERASTLLAKVLQTTRARVNVTRAIKAALAAIAEHDAALGHYLAATFKTGAFCSYSPDPRDAVAWEL